MDTEDWRIVRLDYGYFVRPTEETGTGQARVEPVLGYAVLHPQGTLLLDTGTGGASGRRRALPPAACLIASGAWLWWLGR